MEEKKVGFFGKIYNFFAGIFLFIKYIVVWIYKSIRFFIFFLGFLMFVAICFRFTMIYNQTKINALKPKESVVLIDFSKDISEIKGDDLLMDLAGISPIAFYDLVNGIQIAKKDENIKGIVADLSSVDLGLAQIEEVREAIKDFRSTGKKAYAYSSSFGSFSGGTSSYYLATAFDEIWIQPVSQIGITGINIEIPFFKTTFEKIGIQPEFYSRYEYKNAFANMMSDKMSDEQREDTTKLASSIFENIISEISLSRKIDKSELLNIVNNAPVLIENEKNTNLVDYVDYKPELVAKMTSLYGEGVIEIGDYIACQKVVDSKNVIALLVLEGVINEGYSKNNFLKEEGVIGSSSVVEEIDAIMKNKDVKALVIRINSPGGSYNASNEIWYALKKLKSSRKIPIIISMGDTSASGGYFIALAGDKIFADNLTITGSIGVLGGKVSLEKLWEKLGVTWDRVSIGENSSILSINKSFNEKELEIFNKSLDNIYKDFTNKVSINREIPLEELDKLARGRVWIGELAVGNKLVDEIGGINSSILEAVKMSGIVDGQYQVMYYPRSKTFQEKIKEMMSGKGSMISSSVLAKQLGLDMYNINMIKSFEYDTIMSPIKISK